MAWSASSTCSLMAAPVSVLVTAPGVYLTGETAGAVRITVSTFAVATLSSSAPLAIPPAGQAIADSCRRPAGSLAGTAPRPRTSWPTSSPVVRAACRSVLSPALVSAAMSASA